MHNQLRGALRALIAALLLSTTLSHPALSQIKINTSEMDGRQQGNLENSSRNLLQPAVPLLTIAPDSRASGMGDLGAASSPDINSQHWNVAKYAMIPDRWGVGFSYIPWLPQLVRGEINLMYLAGYYRIGQMQTVSASLRYFSLGQMIFTDINGSELMRHNPNEFALDLGYSRKFTSNLTGGIAFRYIRSDLSGGFSQQNAVGATKAGSSFAADLGIYYRLPLRVMARNAEFALGFSLSNIGSKLSYNGVTKQFIPVTMRIGSSFSLQLDEHNLLSAHLEASKLLIPTPPQYGPDRKIIRGKNPDVPLITGIFQSFADAPGGIKEEFHEVYWAVGLEYIYAKQFSLRAGYFYEHESKGGRKYFTIGAGFNYNILTIDAAYLIPSAGFNSPMAHTVRFSLLVNIAPTERRVKVETEETE